MEETKIHLSGTEIELMCNAEIILTKNVVLYKIKTLLESIEYQMQLQVQDNDIWKYEEVFSPSSKISRGENYLGLPYFVLDYPRQFDSMNIFTVRTLFWWGHFFSSTLHITGNYKETFLPNLEAAYEILAAHDYYICTNEDQWQHHFEEDNYIMIADLTEEEFQQYCRQYDHLKIAAKWSLWQWHEAAGNLLKSWKVVLKICFP